ncbi:MAG: tRNA (adenosine(37)-N6)-dimethylallyltransferase MiaA [Anaerolineaceae bacterium]|jgi:tRNA dimethylallyltransferase|nr:tRNA (adenosine(37)-N6)-dimethylallyltransferase MiaA [Anaerolineaceae bacterium]MDI9531703.1 tRNA (adenosine(37)-N6)-dimethylallyltransferase MiaA [Chloroflexota bacterium]NLE92946.1 tRNA (adenosine(37)-N6)-dimethylallyltransferase MiaA [Chloroflexota bacterium]
MNKKPLLVLIGPTASGKSAFAIQLARSLNGEIVSADSRYLYKELNIGVAKPSPAELASVSHHLINVASLADPWNLGLYKKSATHVIEQIQNRGVLPILTGGTGQYIRSILQNWQVPSRGPDGQLRADLETIGAKIGFDRLYDLLAAIDPEAAANIDYRNHRRTVRALEVILNTGRKFSEQRDKAEPPYETLILGLEVPREVLYARIDQRINDMLAGGLLEEVQSLLDAGFGSRLDSMRVIGYNEIISFLKGELTLEEAVALIKRNTRVYVRRQANWFKPSDPNIHWLNAQDPALLQNALDLVASRFGVTPQ